MGRVRVGCGMQDGNPKQFSAIESTSYTVDSAFRITGLTNASNSALSWTDGYDSLDRITSANQTATALSWGYDADGNRTVADRWRIACLQRGTA